MSDSESSCTSPTPSAKAANPKRCNKPQMERKRRERINCSLNVLKQLVLDALKKDTSQYSKLEKADILEMTVKHLRDLQRRQLVNAATTDASVVGKYRAGFTECASEVTRYLGSVDGLKPEVRDRLVQHLSGCVQRVNIPAEQHAAHVQTIQQAHYTTSGVAPQTSPSPVNVLPVSSVPATRPIQIQIPVATSPASLPGAGVQALQLAVASGAADLSAYHISRGASPQQQQHQQQTPPPQAQTPPQLATATYSPVGTPAYIGAFQVIPNGQTTFMLPQTGQQQIAGLVNAGTPIYAVNASPVQQAQLQQMILSQAHLAVPATTTISPTTTAPPPVAPSSVSGKRRAGSDHHTDSSRAIKKFMTQCNPSCGVKAGVKVAFNDSLQEEKVWRPW